MNYANPEKSDIQFEIAFFERLIQSNPDFTDALIPLAELYTHMGEYKKGLAIDKRLARLKKKDATVFYNLACSYSLLTMLDESCEALLHAVELGYADIAHMYNDKDLENLRHDKRFKKIVSEMKKSIEL